MSLDGPQEAHNACRVTPGGEGTYAPALAAAERARAAFPDLCVSAVLTAAFPKPLEVYRHLLGLGFRRVVVKPVRGRPSDPFAFTPENLPELIEGYREYARFLASEICSHRRDAENAEIDHQGGEGKAENLENGKDREEGGTEPQISQIEQIGLGNGTEGTGAAERQTQNSPPGSRGPILSILLILSNEISPRPLRLCGESGPVTTRAPRSARSR